MKINTQNLPHCKNCNIQKSALFEGLETNDLNKARSLRTSQMTYSSGEYLYCEGDTPTKTLTIFDGWVALFKMLEDGKRQILNFSLPGDLLCYKAKKESTLDHSAIALSDVTLCVFPTESFRNSFSKFPDLSFTLSAINESAMERCHTTLTIVASQTAETKVAYLLLSLYIRELYRHHDNNGYIKFPIIQEDIGDALGLTAVHVNRIYQKLRKQKLIECNNKSLKIINLDEMAKVAKMHLSDLKQLIFVI